MQEYDNQSIFSNKVDDYKQLTSIPDVVFNTLNKMEEVGEKQFIDFFKRSTCLSESVYM